jgi:hypothetical protein
MIRELITMRGTARHAERVSKEYKRQTMVPGRQAGVGCGEGDRIGSERNVPLMTVRTLAISCMILYLTLLSLSWPKPRWYVAGARPTGMR